MVSTTLRADDVTRTEYRALGDVTGQLCTFFGHDLDTDAARRITQALCACERIDAFLDDGRDRDQAFADLAAAVRGDAHRPISDAAQRLADAFADRATADEIVQWLWHIEAATRRQRTLRRGAFIRAVEDEGRAFAALFVPLFDGAPAAFFTFFATLGPPGNLIDKFLDAELDHKNRELLLPPTFWHRARLLLAFARHAPRVLVTARRRPAFLGWTLRLAAHQWATSRRLAGHDARPRRARS